MRAGGGLRIEGGRDLESLLVKSAIAQQRAAQISHANENHRLQPRRAQDLGQFIG